MDTTGYWLRESWTLTELGKLAQQPGPGPLALRLYAAMVVLSWRCPVAQHPDLAEVLKVLGKTRVDVDARADALTLLEARGFLERTDGGGFRFPELTPPDGTRLRPDIVWNKPSPTWRRQWQAIAATRSPGRMVTLIGAILRCSFRRGDGSVSGLGRCRRRLITELFGVCEMTVSRAWRALQQQGLVRRVGDPDSDGPLFDLAGTGVGTEPRSGGRPAKTVDAKDEHSELRRSTTRKHAVTPARRARSERASAQDALHVDAAELAAVPGWIAVWKRYVRAKAISPQLPLQVFGRTLLCAQRLGRSPGAMVRVAAQRGIWFGCARDEDRAQRMIATYKAARDREELQPAGQAADLVTALAQKWAC